MVSLGRLKPTFGSGYQRENGAAMFWTVFVERDGRAEPAGTAYELSSGEIILPAIAASSRVLLKHDFKGS